MSTVTDPQLESLRRIRQTLEAEHAALLNRDADALLAASLAKSEALAQATRPGGQQAAASREVRELAVICRALNEENGRLIRGQRRRVEGSLKVLIGGRLAPDTYGRDGESQLARSTRQTLASY